ncbi:hypothetical protein [Lysobacter gummosus]|uniref:hypothetical protein n=1 Tax=Lysobacter gummosus TaxID=262324 RepID=UPI003634C406
MGFVPARFGTIPGRGADADGVSRRHHRDPIALSNARRRCAGTLLPATGEGWSCTIGPAQGFQQLPCWLSMWAQKRVVLSMLP